MVVDIPSLDATLTRWEYGEYAAAAVVIVGVAGEFFAEFSDVWRIQSFPGRKNKLGKVSTLILLAGLASELVCLVSANVVSGRIIASLGEQTAEAQKQAALANLALAKLKAPRHLSDDQQQAIVKELKSFAGTSINLLRYPDDSEIDGIALEITNVLTAARWNVAFAVGKEKGRFVVGIAVN